MTIGLSLGREPVHSPQPELAVIIVSVPPRLSSPAALDSAASIEPSALPICMSETLSGRLFTHGHLTQSASPAEGTPSVRAQVRAALRWRRPGAGDTETYRCRATQPLSWKRRNTGTQLVICCRRRRYLLGERRGRRGRRARRCTCRAIVGSGAEPERCQSGVGASLWRWGSGFGDGIEHNAQRVATWDAQTHGDTPAGVGIYGNAAGDIETRRDTF